MSLETSSLLVSLSLSVVSGCAHTYVPVTEFVSRHPMCLPGRVQVLERWLPGPGRSVCDCVCVFLKSCGVSQCVY